SAAVNVKSYRQSGRMLGTATVPRFDVPSEKPGPAQPPGTAAPNVGGGMNAAPASTCAGLVGSGPPGFALPAADGVGERRLFENDEAPPVDHGRSRWNTMSVEFIDAPKITFAALLDAPKMIDASSVSPPGRLGLLMPYITS